MFRTRIAPRFALGIAAAALSLTSLVSAVAPASADQVFKPDLQVKYTGETGVGGAHFYQFEVKNIGQSASTHASFDGTLYRKSDNLSVLDSKRFDMKMSPLQPGQSTIISVPCNDSGGGQSAVLKCVGFKMGAYEPEDIDYSNNEVANGMHY